MWLTFMWLWALSTPSHASDWLTLLGTEEGRPDRAVRVFGFVQPQVEASLGGAVTGLTSEALLDNNGTRPAFNTVAGGSTLGMRLLRARLGVRGAVPHTDQRVNYFVLLEAGSNGITRTNPVVATDLSATLSYVPGARVRIGKFKLPVMEETLQSIPASFEFILLSTTASRLLLDNPVKDGAYTGGSSAVRDVGVQVFDTFERGQIAGSYAVMVSNGVGALDHDANKDVTVRGSIAWVTQGDATSPRRHEIALGGWWLEGKREGDQRRMRRGAFLHVERDVVWALVEVAHGYGMLETGRTTPFAGSPVQVVVNGEAVGVVAQAGVRFPLGEDQDLGLKLRYEQYHQGEHGSLRVFRTATVGTELTLHKRVRLQANYEVRRLAAPHAGADAKTIASSMGDRVLAQATVRF